MGAREGGLAVTDAEFGPEAFDHYHSARHDSDNVDHFLPSCGHGYRIKTRCTCTERRPATVCRWCDGPGISNIGYDPTSPT